MISRGETTGDELHPESTKYKCSAEVTINFSRGSTIIVDGRTGGTKNALIQYTDDGNGYQNTPLLKDIGGLKLIEGAGKANLKLQNLSSFQESANIDIPVKTELHLTDLRVPPNIKSLNGGGILILGENQRLTISGAVAGTTPLAISDLTYSDANSTQIPQTNHTYISAPKSVADSFVLLPPLADEEMKISKDSQGAWTVKNH